MTVHTIHAWVPDRAFLTAEDGSKTINWRIATAADAGVHLFATKKSAAESIDRYQAHVNKSRHPRPVKVIHAKLNFDAPDDVYFEAYQDDDQMFGFRTPRIVGRFRNLKDALTVAQDAQFVNIRMVFPRAENTIYASLAAWNTAKKHGEKDLTDPAPVDIFWANKRGLSGIPEVTARLALG